MNARRRNAKRRHWPANLYCKPDGYFWYRNPETGATKGLGRDRVKAFDEARSANLVLANKKPSSLADWIGGAGTKTLRECAIEYEAGYLAEHQKENTTKQMKSSIRFICAAPFAGKPVDRITTQECHEFLKETEKTRGPSAALQRRMALRDIFYMAEAQGLIKRGENPVTITKAPKTPVRRDRLSLEQFLAIREQASGWLVNAMNLALVSGQRREDIAAAQFDDVRDGYWYCNQGKTGAKLRLALSIRLNAVNLSLEDVIRQCRDSTLSKHMIHYQRSSRKARAGARLTLDVITKAFATARDQAGIVAQEGKRPPSFHEIRSLSERLYEKEYGGTFTQKLLGHKSAKMTAVYHDLRGSDWVDVTAV